MTSSSATAGPMNLRVEFSGGLESLFGGIVKHSISVPRTVPTDGRPVDLSFLIAHLRDHALIDRHRPELFVQGDTIRPGILVLVNDADWELEGGLAYTLQPDDEICFISTLHGG